MFFRIALTVMLLSATAAAEPGVALLVNSRQPAQADLSARAKRGLIILLKQNNLQDFQFSLKTVDFADPNQAWRWERDFEITRQDLPALAFYDRQGNKLQVRNLIRRYRDPYVAAQQALTCAQAQYPGLISSVQIFTGVRVKTHPEGVEIWEGETRLGTSPMDVTLRPGRHELSLQHPDFQPTRQTVNLKVGDQPELDWVMLPAPAVMTIESAGAPFEVTLDGRLLGRTPVTVETTAGAHELKATQGGAFPIETQLRAEPNARTVARLSPTPARVRLGWRGIEAEGYSIERVGYQSVPSAYGYYGPRRRCGVFSSYSYNIPYVYTETVELSSIELDEYARQELADHVTLIEPSATSWDCSLNLKVQAVPGEVLGEVVVVDRAGVQLTAFQAQRDMPWLSFDEQSAADVRAREVTDELLGKAMEFIRANVPHSGLSPEDAAASVQTQVEGPLQ